MAEVMEAAGVNTKKDAVKTAMEHYLRLHRQRRILQLQGKFHWEGDLDEMRQGRVL